MKAAAKMHNSNDTQILIIEDDFLFSTVIKHLLTEASFEARNIDNAASISEVSALVSELNPDVILLDLNITDSHGEATYLSVSKLFPSVPIIILSGMEDNDLALKIVKDGAQDYILKSDVNSSLLTKSIEYGIERKQLMNGIRESEKKFRNVFDNSPLPMLIIEPNLKIEASNYVAQNFYGLSKAKIETMNFNEMNSGEVLWSIDSVFDSFNKRIIQRDFRGRDLHVELVGNKIAIDQEKYICLVIDRTDEYLFEQNKYKIVNEVQEKEKKLLAMELHDGLCQQLVLLNLWLQSIQVDEKYSDTKANIDQLILSIITEARNLSYKL
jgi:PAS domain S-box-containing protein